MRASGNMSVGLVVGLVALVLVYQKLGVSDSGANPEIEEAISDLDSDDVEQRERAHEFLLEAETESVEELLAALQDQQARRPEEIILALSEIGDDGDDGDEKGKKVILGLREALSSHPDALARREAAVALAEMPDHEAVALLQKRISSDPALQVRQAALLALADLGDESLARDLAALLDPSTVPELRESAGKTLEVMTDQVFEGNRAAAEAWLEEQDAPPARSVVAGVGAQPGRPLLSGASTAGAGGTSVRIVRQDDQLRFELTGRLGLPMNLLLQMDQSRIVVELVQEDQQITARCFDTPETGRHLPRHAPIAVESTAEALRFSIPRVGALVSPDLPRKITVISQE